MDDGREAARAAGLRYVKPGEPGLTRQRRGKAFTYIDSGGKRVTDDEVLARIRHLAIPPAWENVWICRDDNGHLQATGLDVRGRKQYRYHHDWAQRRNETKFHRMIAFADALSAMRRRILADMGQHGLPRERVVACVVDLLEKTLIRVGNAEYAKANDSYGLTTIHNEHVTLKGATIRFAFRGKSGKTHDIAVNDPRAARIVKRCQELPGHELFGYLDDDGVAHDITSADVNTYLATACCGEFTAKDFRTWGGTVRAFELFHALGPVGTEREAKRNVVDVIKRVANHLGNTPAMSRKYYIHPAVIAAYMDGSLFDELPPHRTPSELSKAEADVLSFLKSRPAHTAARAQRKPNLARDLRASLRRNKRRSPAEAKSRTLRA